MQTPILQTERMILRPLLSSDAKMAFKNWTSDSEVAKFMRWNVHNDLSQTLEWMQSEEENIMGDNYTFGYVLKSSGELIGSGGLNFNTEHGCYELGYNIMKARWGKGIATEAARRIIYFAKEELGEKKIYACHAPENFASQQILIKLNFKHHGKSTYKKFDGSKSFDAISYFLEL